MRPRVSPVGAGLVLVAASLWGIGGLFAREVLAQGVAPAQVAFYANALSLLVLAGALSVMAPRYLRVRRDALGVLLAVGLFGNGLAFLCYTNAIARSSLSLASVLMYTSPAWVALLAWRFLGEPIGPRRLVAVAIAFVGVALLAQAYDPAALQASLPGVLFGVAGGFSYGVYVVLSKRALRRHHPFTVTLYGYVGSVLVLLPLQLAEAWPARVLVGAWPWLLLYVLGSQLGGGLSYNTGLRRTSAGLVSVLALWSPITTLTLSALLLGESLSLPQLVGALLVIGSVIAMQSGQDASEPAQPDLASARAPARAG